MASARRPGVPLLSTTPRWTDFGVGLSLPFRGLGLILREPKLRGLSFVSAAITLFTLTLVVLGAWHYTDDLVTTLWAQPEAWYGRAAWYLVVALTFVLLLVVGANTLPLLVLSPLQDFISEATEEACGGFQSPPFSLAALVRSVGVSLAHTLGRIALLLFGHALLALLNFIPGVGSVLWTVLATVWTALWMGAEYLAGPMARHNLPFSHVRRAVGRRLGLSLGFGAAVYVVLWVPLLNVFFVPMAIVGGTLLYLGLAEVGELAVESKGSGTRTG